MIKLLHMGHKYINVLIRMQIFRSQLVSSCYKFHELYESVRITSSDLARQAPRILHVSSGNPKSRCLRKAPKKMQIKASRSGRNGWPLVYVSIIKIKHTIKYCFTSKLNKSPYANNISNRSLNLSNLVSRKQDYLRHVF